MYIQRQVLKVNSSLEFGRSRLERFDKRNASLKLSKFRFRS
jgi:hypothetical protein